MTSDVRQSASVLWRSVTSDVKQSASMAWRSVTECNDFGSNLKQKRNQTNKKARNVFKGFKEAGCLKNELQWIKRIWTWLVWNSLGAVDHIEVSNRSQFHCVFIIYQQSGLEKQSSSCVRGNDLQKTVSLALRNTNDWREIRDCMEQVELNKLALLVCERALLLTLMERSAGGTTHGSHTDWKKNGKLRELWTSYWKSFNYLSRDFKIELCLLLAFLYFVKFTIVECWNILEKSADILSVL